MIRTGGIVFVFISLFAAASADANGGTTCAACSILIGLAEQLAQVHATDVISAVENYLCVNLPNPLDTACKSLLDEFGPVLIDGIYHKETPDIICYNIGLCKQDPGKDYCHLFPLPANFDSKNLHRRPVAHLSNPRLAAIRDIEDYPACSLPGVKDICEIINRFAEEHLPIQDKDSDKYSIEPTLRGSHWRGKDCDDGNKNSYPGRKPIDHDRTRDSNCNGIYGVDPSSGTPYEDLFCSESSPRGIAVLGDSAAAHFHLPPEYFMAELLNKDTFQDALMLLTDEFDWPELSAVTAFTSNQWPHSIDGPVDSLYMRILKENKCIHRDYQSIAVNGADSGNMRDTMKGLARNATADYPLVVVLALIGNDVCNGHADTISAMTTPKEYRSNMMEILQYLNDTIPAGSVVVISGLADGRVLWNTMSERIHPVGQLNSDVKYKDIYGFLNCLEVSPCMGWMSSNESLRNYTSERAAQLSAQSQNIVATEKFKQFQMVYMDYDIKEMMNDWESRGGSDWEVIEPVDGFHPGQVAQALSAEYMYTTLDTKIPGVVGKANPFNSKISEMFGDQGGY